MKDPIISRFVRMSRDLKSKVGEIYLFGSRSNGQARPDSDYDLLCIVEENFSFSDKNTLYDRAMDILLETGAVLSFKIFRKSEFSRLRRLHTPFIETILKQRVRVG